MPLRPGAYSLEVQRGIDFLSEELAFDVRPGVGAEATVPLEPWLRLREMGWANGDAHAHLYSDTSGDPAMLATVRRICRAQGVDFLCACQTWAGYAGEGWRDAFAAHSDTRFRLLYGAEMPKYRTGHTFWFGLDSTRGLFDRQHGRHLRERLLPVAQRIRVDVRLPAVPRDSRHRARLAAARRRGRRRRRPAPDFLVVAEAGREREVRDERRGLAVGGPPGRRHLGRHGRHGVRPRPGLLPGPVVSHPRRRLPDGPRRGARRGLWPGRPLLLRLREDLREGGEGDRPLEPGARRALEPHVRDLGADRPRAARGGVRARRRRPRRRPRTRASGASLRLGRPPRPSHLRRALPERPHPPAVGPEGPLATPLRRPHRRSARSPTPGTS